MKILQTPVRFSPFVGGVEATVHDLSTKLVTMGHEVTVVCTNATAESEARETIDGIDVRRLTSVGSIANTNLTPALPAVLLQEARSADVIHTHIPTPWYADLSALAGLVTGTPVVVTYHNDIVGEGLADTIAGVYNATMLRVTLGLTDRIVVTQPNYVDHSPHLDRYREKIEVIPNGVDVAEYQPVEVGPDRRSTLGIDPDRPTLFFLSVLDDHHDYKGLEELFAATAQLVESGVDPQVVIGGDGEKREWYQDRAAALGVADSVEFLGRVPQDDLVAYYAASDLFVLPSTSSDQEGFGLVLLEALACGTPVVTTDVVGIADEVASEPIGVVVTPGDSNGLAAGIRDALDQSFDTERGRALCEESYSWAASAEQMMELYEGLIGN